MIEYLKIEITPTMFVDRVSKELKIEVNISGKPPYVRMEICEVDDLNSFFDQIFDRAKQEIRQILKGKPNGQDKAL